MSTTDHTPFTFPNRLTKLQGVPLSKDHPIVNFWHSLPNAVLVKTSKISHLELPNGATWLGCPLWGNTLLVRRAYTTLWAQIIGDTYPYHHWVITGTPGVGKSFFAYFLMYQIRKTYPDAIIMYDSVHRSQVFYPDGQVVFLNDSLKLELAGIEGTWHIFDAVTPPSPIVARQVLVTSPQPQHWGDAKPPVYNFRYMPIWSWSELLQWNTLQKEDKQIAQDELQKRFEQWGGIPRTMVGLGKSDVQKEYRADLRNVNPEIYFKLESQRSYKNLPVGTITGKVLHIIPINRELSMNIIQFATVFIREKCIYQLLKNHTSKLQNILVGIEGGSLRGILFESLAHRRLLEGGDFRITRLASTEKSQTLSIPRDIKCHLFEEHNPDLHPNSYNLPISKTHPTIDATIPNLQALFQMTIAETHPIKWSRLEKHMQSFQGSSNDRILFIFVVPVMKEGNSPVMQRAQKFEEGTKKRTKRMTQDVQDFIARIDQYILPMTAIGIDECRKLDDFFGSQETEDIQDEPEEDEDEPEENGDDVMEDI